ncbi:hypothetical protein [Bacillus sp. JJ722]|uniref:hypothetical protein n=1 Tax=Bacillus sp. JJ722 TaxID=3122973 RepID=UPI002FFE721F
MNEHYYDYPTEILNQQYNTNWMERSPVGGGAGATAGIGAGIGSGTEAGTVLLPPTGAWYYSGWHPSSLWQPYHTWHPAFGWTYWF